MVIVGYQGIGKSSLSKKSNKYIDLESSNFFVNGVRDDNWYIVYANIAEYLSNQGYLVFTSSHKVVREELSRRNMDRYIIAPDIALKDEWIDKLEKRYSITKMEKDYKALMNAKDCFEDNIQELFSDSNFKSIRLSTINYSLERLVNCLK